VLLVASTAASTDTIYRVVTSSKCGASGSAAGLNASESILSQVRSSLQGVPQMQASTTTILSKEWTHVCMSACFCVYTCVMLQVLQTWGSALGCMCSRTTTFPP
jgi:hypothetical protein